MVDELLARGVDRDDRAVVELLDKALAYFTTPEAFEVFARAFADEGWRGNGSGMLRLLRFFDIEEDLSILVFFAAKPHADESKDD